ncbi:lipopolysaccharide biosynthesis protein [Planctomonas psychrotolerans]|uniref:lipopolysaccharide biosynthesis protein n=1 Tax=Planctomonas psychrotolerans TaxID=2528712 RepID=UPI001D0D652C|nr:lipopolysaccharide biosynthesis protein [Planctomonas psychrotolerans]
MNLADAAARGSGVTLLSQLLRVALQFGSTIILARLLVPGDFGLVAMAAAVVSFAEVIRDFGLSSAAIQSKTLSNDERTNLFWANTALGAACTLLAILAAPLIVLLYGDDRLLAIVYALSASFLIGGLNTQFKADLTRRMQFTALATVDIVCVTVGILAGVIGALAGMSYWAIILQQLTTTMVSFLLCVVLSRWKPGLPQRHVSIRRFMRFGGGLLGTQAISYLTKNVDSIAIGVVWGAGPLGLYDRAYQLLMTPLNQINAPMTRVALPVLSQIQDEKERYQRYLLKAQLVGAYVTASVFAVSAGLAVPLVAVLFGDRWAGVAPIFAILAIGGVFRAMAQISYWMYLSLGLTGAQLRMFLAVRPVMVVIMLAGVPWGPVGVAVGQTLAYSLHWAVSLWRVGVVSGIPTAPLFANALRIVGVVSVPCGVASWAATLIDVAPLLQLLIGLGFAAAYALLAALLVPFVRRDLAIIQTFARRMVSRRKGKR